MNIEILIVALSSSAVVTISLIIYLSFKSRKVSKGFTTRYGITIKPSYQMAWISPDDIDKWTEELIKFWHERKNIDPKKIIKAFNGIRIIFYDQEYLLVNRKNQTWKVNAITFLDKNVAISTWSKGQTFVNRSRIYYLFRHEISHVIVFCCIGAISQEDSHTLFANVGID
jgi:hypothetical protein